MTKTIRPQDVLDFWFGAADGPAFGERRDIWFKKDKVFDDKIRATFQAVTEEALIGGLAEWEEGNLSSLALLILLDQFPRNLFRGSGQSFAGDFRARQVAASALNAGAAEQFIDVQKLFLQLPFVHSEDMTDQNKGVSLMQGMTDGEFKVSCVDSAIRHREIIERFGRFPHRNEMLGRKSTDEEIEFLKGPNSSF